MEKWSHKPTFNMQCSTVKVLQQRPSTMLLKP